MKAYRVWASYTNYCYLDIEAEDEEQTLAIASETDGWEYTPSESYESDTWSIDEVEEM